VVPQQRRERAASTLETGSVATTERIVRKKHAIISADMSVDAPSDLEVDFFIVGFGSSMG
jgi:hypothetical protein